MVSFSGRVLFEPRRWSSGVAQELLASPFHVMIRFLLFFAASSLDFTESLGYNIARPSVNKWKQWKPMYPLFGSDFGKQETQDWDRPDYRPEGDVSRAGGNGEWEDWLGEEAFIGDDEMGSDDDEEKEQAPAEPSTKSFSEWKLVGGPGGGGDSEDLGGWDNLLKSSNGGGIGKSASENWAGWSEEAPFFEDEPDERAPTVSLGSSDLWTRTKPPEVVEEKSDRAQTQASSFDQRASVVPQPLSAIADLSLVEMKLQSLSREVSSLKTFVALLVGLVIGLELGDHGL